MKAWVFQDYRQKQKHGNKAPWSVGWLDLEGKRKSRRIGSKSMAHKFARKIEGQLAAGTYAEKRQILWRDFRAEYETRIVPTTSIETRRVTLQALAHFERIVRPKRVEMIKAQTIDDYIVRRQSERGKKPGSLVSPATVNKELRHLKAVLRIAHDWAYLPNVPRIRTLREPGKIPQYVTPDHFDAIYEACREAALPNGLPYASDDWWRAILTFIAMTGWRIRETLSLGREDLDMKLGVAITRFADNKGKKDELIPLHEVVVQHLQKIPSFEPVVFPWNHSREALWREFRRIQQAAGIHLPCHDEHDHTAACHVYGFHDLRRAFATLNARSLPADVLQTLMRHQSYTTTQLYINMAKQLDGAVEKLHAPTY